MPRELASREGELLIDPPSMDKLQTLRNDLARPMVITSAYISPAHNRTVGGATGSLHLQGKAFDVVLGNHDPHAIITAARKAGFTGIGTYPRQGLIHIDTGRVRTWGDPFPQTATGLALEPVKARPPVIDSVPPAPLPSPASPRHRPCQGRHLHPRRAGCCRAGLLLSEMTMNPLILFKTLRDLSALIKQANRLAGPDKRWSLAFTNRSFVVACVAFVAAAALMIGLPFPMPIDVTAETIYAIITVASLI
ncbi:YcbK family protein [Paracoccus marcusii]|uniref:YcbK family protein n=1 Tax=Paracoccus marcusii TaxID=59779 RepID=UPI001AD82FC8|nr:D-Ala-D-Ala carboxypeptidase family metallohydrolase [Paracoccus marcusii]